MIQQSHSWHIFGQNYNLKRYMHSYVHSSTSHNSQGMEAAQMSPEDEWLKYYNGILPCCEKNEIMPFAATWRHLKIIVLSEASHKKKDEYHLVSLICEI